MEPYTKGNSVALPNGQQGFFIEKDSFAEALNESNYLCEKQGYYIVSHQTEEVPDKARNALTAIAVGMGAFGQSMAQQHGNPNAENTAAQVARYHTKIIHQVMIGCGKGDRVPIANTQECVQLKVRSTECDDSPNCSVDELNRVNDFLKQKGCQ